MARLLLTATLLTALGCLGKPAPGPAVPTSSREEVEEEEGPDPETSNLVARLEELAARDVLQPEEAAQHHKEAESHPLADGNTGKTKNMCKGGKCPSGYRCGSAPGRPRKVCYAAGKHRAGSSSMFERTVP
jgi:hypothetical protein